MNTVRKDFQRLTKEVLQTSHTDEESSQRGSEVAQVKPGPGDSDTAREGNETHPQERLPRKPDREENAETRPQERLPRKLGREEVEETRPQERLPRKLDREEVEATRPQERLPRKLDREENEETRPQEPSPRKADERVPGDDQKLPRKQSEQILGDIARPVVDQSLPTPGNEEDANRPSNMKPERHPRRKD